MSDKQEIFSIFNTNAASMSPLKTFKFRVRFYSSTVGLDSFDFEEVNEKNLLVPLKVSLPTQKHDTIQRWYKGTPKTHVTNINRSGDTTMEFIVKDVNVLSIASLFGLPHEQIAAKSTNTDASIEAPERDFGSVRELGSIQIDVYRDADSMPYTSFTLLSCTITDISFSELSYESNELIRMTLQVHYDTWTETVRKPVVDLKLGNK